LLRKKENTGGKVKKRKKKIINAFIILIFLTGAGILLYPTCSNIWNVYRNSQLISKYSRAVKALSENDYKKIWDDAEAYNKQHTQNVISDAFSSDGDYILTHPYDNLLNPDNDEIMGYVEIPKISVKLAIYHGVGEKALEEGCGHIEGTSLPIGGEDTHAVLAAHRGLPSAKLFTDLDQLKIGDVFYIHILDNTLAYKVNQVLVVNPDETEALAIENGKDYVTLLTCTPYGVNTQRLLVRGERTEYTEEEKNNSLAQSQLEQADSGETAPILLAAGIAIVIIIIIILRKRYGDRRSRD